MRPSRHLAVSTAAGGALWAITGEPVALPITAAAGVLVDIDHAPDYWWALALERKPLVTLLFHGWEWLAAMVVLGLWVGFPWWLLAMTVGYGLHLVGDYVFNPGGLGVYSLIYRARHGFRKTRLAPGWDLDHAYCVLRQEVPPAAGLVEWWRGRAPTRSRGGS